MVYADVHHYCIIDCSRWCECELYLFNYIDWVDLSDGNLRVSSLDLLHLGAPLVLQPGLDSRDEHLPTFHA